MRRLFVVLLGLAAAAPAASEFGRTLRALKADDRYTRREALKAFAQGEVKPGSASQTRRALAALKRFLSDRAQGAERALAVTALGRLEDGDAVLDLLLRRLEKEEDDRVLAACAAVFAKGPLDRSIDLAKRIQEAEDPLHRARLVRMLGALPGPDARERIRLRARMADDWCPRAAALHALKRDRGAEALKAAAQALDCDDVALQTAAIESLVRLSGKNFGRDLIAWKAWWKTREAVEPVEEAMEKAGKPDERVYAEEQNRRTIAGHFFGIPIRGRRVVFVFDVSASMRYKLPIAYEQLVRSVKSLPSTARFEVIFFNEHVYPWRGRLSHADPVTKQLLVSHLDTIEIKSYTNLFDSIEKAFELKPDEIFVISDGAPNRGRKKFPSAIRKALKERNRFGVRINTVSVVRVVDGEEHIALLAGIAEDHGGEHVQRTLK